MDRDRLVKLLGLYFDEGLTEETKQELERMLLASPQARELFWQKAKMHSMLRQQGQESWGSEQGSANPSSQKQSPPADTSDVFSGAVDRDHHPTLVSLREHPNAEERGVISKNTLTRVVTLLLAASVLIAVGLQFYSSQRSQIQVAEQQATGDVPRYRQRNVSETEQWVALLRKAVDVHWIDADSAPNLGEPMPPRRIQFESGLIEIQTTSGALMVLEGPADLEIISDMEVRCRQGRFRVDVPPPAEGFLVHAPFVKVVDRGTAFAMNINPNEETEVHVIDGLVELVSPTDTDSMRELRKGDSVSVASAGAYRDIPSQSNSFPSESQIRSRSRGANVVRKLAWQRRRDALTEHPDCLVYFDFSRSELGETVLTNHAVHAEKVADGTIVGCNRAQGRWPGKEAIEFKSMSDRIRFSLPGVHTTLTCITSVRLDALDTSISSLLTSDGDLVGDFRWWIAPESADSARLSFERRERSLRSEVQAYPSSPVFRRSQLGTWVQLAFVWDGEQGTVRQYVNGNLVSNEPIRSFGLDHARMLRLDKVEIGNSSLIGGSYDAPVRNFNGRMDEFAIFGSALNPQELLAYYDLAKVSWSNTAEDNRWSESANWSLGILPAQHDVVRVDRSDREKLIVTDETIGNLKAIHIGTARGEKGEMDILGGTITATVNSNSYTRVGVAGGDGVVKQFDGDVTVNALQIGLDKESQGNYEMSGGKLLLMRGVKLSSSSLEVGSQQGVGSFEISAGSLESRAGVTLGYGDGVGTFRVRGSDASKIRIGSFGSFDGFWVQNTGSTLATLIDDRGVSTIFIDEVGNDGGGDVTFADGALLDVGFVGESQVGSWDVMKWDGKLNDHGLRFAEGVDQSVWSFQFVDTDSSGDPDTLRVTAAR
ncbi:LamG-like jellyroll fold domain-containing protein [Novipirellula caenicola]|uniref:FecR protein n=1 Tax=Novipirellula caenicola TaxID=1536901 RepID=A0ABP9VWF3_9BACT